MADNLPNVNLPPETWIDLYSVTGISVGVRIEVQNIGVSDVELATQAAEPDNDNDAHNIVSGREISWQNDPGDSGAWARSRYSAGKLAVKVAT